MELIHHPTYGNIMYLYVKYKLKYSINIWKHLNNIQIKAPKTIVRVL